MNNERKLKRLNKAKYKGHLLSLTIKNIKTMFRDKTELAWIIGYPLILIFVFSLAFGFTSSLSKFDLIIFNEDPNQPESLDDYSLVFIGILENNLTNYINLNQSSYSKSEAEKELKYERVDAIIFIPNNFTETIINNETVRLDIRIIPDIVTEGVVGSITKQIIDLLIIFHNNGTPSEVVIDRVTNTVEITAFDMMAPGFIIAGVTVCISQLALHFAEEKETGTLKRLSTTPVSRGSVLISGLLSQLIVITIQTLILILLLMLFGAYFAPGVNILVLLLIPLLFSFTCLGLGLLLASFTKSQSSAGGLAWFIILPLQFLGGVFFMIDNPISDFIPTSYAVHAMRLVMVSGITTWDAIGVDILVLLGFGIVSTALGILLFRRKTAIL
ncbi:MAG: ABC transporter permease [Promethearchaeota archaeon]